MWPPYCFAMQRYCEPFFTAIDCWRRYSNLQLIINRIHLLEVASKFLTEYPNNRFAYHFELSYDNMQCTLLPEKVPTAGKDAINGGDLIAFEASKSIVPESLFNKVGVFFQAHFLKPISFAHALLEDEAPHSMILALEQLFRLPEDAGKAVFLFRQQNVEEDGQPRLHTFPSQPLSMMGKSIANLLFGSADLVQDAKRSSSLPKSVASTGASIVYKSSRDSVAWTRNHEIVGTKVAAYFAVANGVDISGVQRQLFFGEVVAFAPPSSSKLRNHLYHILWEDGDEEDYDEEQLRKGQELYEASVGWTDDHPMVGMKVAAYFPSPALTPKKKGQSDPSLVLFKGSVTKFSPATNSLDQDQLYHIVWEDGDEEDYDEAQLQRGIELFKLHFETPWKLDHPSVGSSVAAYFPDPACPYNSRPYRGRVTKFSPPTGPTESDQLYHVVWEDGDEEDYDEEQLQKGMLLFETLGFATKRPKKRKR